MSFPTLDCDLTLTLLTHHSGIPVAFLVDAPAAEHLQRVARHVRVVVEAARW